MLHVLVFPFDAEGAKIASKYHPALCNDKIKLNWFIKEKFVNWCFGLSLSFNFVHAWKGKQEILTKTSSFTYLANTQTQNYQTTFLSFYSLQIPQFYPRNLNLLTHCTCFTTIHQLRFRQQWLQPKSYTFLSTQLFLWVKSTKQYSDEKILQGIEEISFFFLIT